MKSFFRNVLSTIIGILLAFIVIIILSVSIISISISSINKEKTLNIKENSVLVLNLEEIEIVERTSNNPLENINLSGKVKKQIELKQLLDNIEKAKKDENIKAIYINTSFINAGLSQTEEIRNKLLEFKKTGKTILAYSEVYSQISYYLSSVANKIYLNPEGGIELKGLSATQMFFKGLFAKLDVDVQIIRHGKFKSAVEPFTLEKMSLENRNQMQLLLNAFADNIMDSIAHQRNISLSTVEKDASQLSLRSAEDCLNKSYVDALLYSDQVKDTLLSITQTDKLNLITIVKYTNVKVKKEKISRNKIAIIYATGPINSGKGDERSIGSETTSKAIKKAREDKNVKAIVFRINSGGGSALASDVIWRETMLARSEKPFVVSMGDYAASGGYYIACAADSIIANPTTLTGSIGVFGMIPNLKNFYKNKLGITFDTVNTNKYADIGIHRKLSDFEKSYIKNSIENIYSTFITRVSNGREMSIEAVDDIGQGRIWSGYDAKDIGLIDSYGGLDKAIEIAACLSKIEDYRTISLPKKKDPLDQLILELSQETRLLDIFERIGIKTEVSKSVEALFNTDPIQARIPFIIELK